MYMRACTGFSKEAGWGLEDVLLFEKFVAKDTIEVQSLFVFILLESESGGLE